MSDEFDLTFGFRGVEIYGNLHVLVLYGQTIAWHRWTNAPEIDCRYRHQRFGSRLTPREVDRVDGGWKIADALELAAVLYTFAAESHSR
jgi:hypothetical protein